MRRILLALLLLFCGAGPAQKRLLLQGEPSLDQLIRQQSPTLWLDSAQSEVEPLVHYLAEDNAASTAVVDASANYAGTANRNTNAWSTASGKITRGFDFYNGNTVDKIDLGSEIIAANSAFTFCVWAKIDTAGGADGGRFISDSAEGDYIYTKATGYLARRGTTVVGTSWTAGVWTHYCFTRPDAGGVTFYQNGASVAYQALHASSAIRYIGNRASNDRSFDGVMDDIRIYNRALTAGEIALIYNNGAGHQSQSIGNNSGTVVYDAASSIVSQWSDKSGNARHFVQATAANQPTLVSQAINGRAAVRFDGAASYMTSAATLADLFAAGAKTVFAVVRLTTRNDDYRILETSSQRFGLYSGITNYMFTVFNYDGTVDNAEAYNTIEVAIVTCTHDGTDLIISVDDGTPVSISSGDTFGTTGTIRIGASVINTNYLDGDIAELLTFNKVLPSDVRERIQRGLCKKWGADC